MNILLATAELHPVVAVGGLAQAAAGPVRELRARGFEVALPDPWDARGDARFARGKGAVVVGAKGWRDGRAG